jgi:hypothetical protein
LHRTVVKRATHGSEVLTDCSQQHRSRTVGNRTLIGPDRHQSDLMRDRCYCPAPNDHAVDTLLISGLGVRSPRVTSRRTSRRTSHLAAHQTA